MNIEIENLVIGGGVVGIAISRELAKLGKETVLIEFRPLPNLEFLIRNTIIKLKDWNHTVVCGNINYNFIKNI